MDLNPRQPGMQRIVRNARDLTVNRVAQPLLAFVLVVVAGRIGSDFLGTYTVVTVWFMIFQTLPMLGLGAFFGRELAIQREQAGVILGSTILLGLGVAALLGLAGVVLLPFAGYPPDVRTAILLSAASAFPSVIIFVAEVYLVTIHDTLSIGPVSLAENAFRLLASLFALACGYGVAMLILVVLVGRIACAAWYLRRMSRSVGGLAFSALYWVRLLRASPLYLFQTLVSLIVGRADFVILSVTATASALAPYAVAYKFLEFGGLLVTAFAGTMFPYFARASTNHEPALFSRLAVQSAKMLLAGVAPACALLYLNADVIVGLLFPRQQAAAVPLVRFLLAALLLASFKTLSSAILLSAPRPGAELAMMSIGAASYLVLLALLVPRYGATGAAIATLIEAAVQSGARAVVMARHFSASALRDERVPALAGGAAALAAAALFSNLLPLDTLARMLVGSGLALAFVAFVVRSGIVRLELPQQVQP